MRKILAFMIALSLLLPTQAFALNPVAQDLESIVAQLSIISDGLTVQQIRDIIQSTSEELGLPEEYIANQILYEASYSLTKAHEAQLRNITPMGSSGGGGGSETTYPLDSSNKGDIFFETASTAGIEHGHVGLYYSDNILVESMPGDGVRTIDRSNKAVASGAKILAVKDTAASTSQKEAAVDWAYSRVGDAYSYNFISNRLKTCDKEKNCSKLVWCAYKIEADIDLDANGGLGVYPTDIRDSNLVTTIKSY